MNGERIRVVVVRRAERETGLTAVEMVIGMAVMGILVAAVAGVMVPLVKASVYLPRKIRVNELANQIAMEMIEGRGKSMGLLGARRILLAQDTRLDYQYIDVDTPSTVHTVSLAWDPVTERVTRSLDGGAVQDLPLTLEGEIRVIPKAESSELFIYFDDNSIRLTAPVANPSQIRYVRTGIEVMTNNGEFNVLNGKSVVISGISINYIED
jgi:hypothetical protein